jgi:hypothetical protein
MNETIEQAIRRLGAPREAWLSGGDTEDDHWRFGIAMSKCQDHSGSCASTGSCTFGGDCFHSALHKAREAASLIRSLGSESASVQGWLNDAADWIEQIARRESAP